MLSKNIDRMASRDSARSHCPGGEQPCNGVAVSAERRPSGQKLARALLEYNRSCLKQRQGYRDESFDEASVHLRATLTSEWSEEQMHRKAFAVNEDMTRLRELLSQSLLDKLKIKEIQVKAIGSDDFALLKHKDSAVVKQLLDGTYGKKKLNTLIELNGRKKSSGTKANKSNASVKPQKTGGMLQAVKNSICTTPQASQDEPYTAKLDNVVLRLDDSTRSVTHGYYFVAVAETHKHGYIHAFSLPFCIITHVSQQWQVSSALFWHDACSLASLDAAEVVELAKSRFPVVLGMPACEERSLPANYFKDCINWYFHSLVGKTQCKTIPRILVKEPLPESTLEFLTRKAHLLDCGQPGGEFKAHKPELPNCACYQNGCTHGLDQCSSNGSDVKWLQFKNNLAKWFYEACILIRSLEVQAFKDWQAVRTKEKKALKACLASYKGLMDSGLLNMFSKKQAAICLASRYCDFTIQPNVLSRPLMLRFSESTEPWGISLLSISNAGKVVNYGPLTMKDFERLPLAACLCKSEQLQHAGLIQFYPETNIAKFTDWFNMPAESERYKLAEFQLNFSGFIKSLHDRPFDPVLQSRWQASLGILPTQVQLSHPVIMSAPVAGPLTIHQELPGNPYTAWPATQAHTMNHVDTRFVGHMAPSIGAQPFDFVFGNLTNDYVNAPLYQPGNTVAMLGGFVHQTGMSHLGIDCMGGEWLQNVALSAQHLPPRDVAMLEIVNVQQMPERNGYYSEASGGSIPFDGALPSATTCSGRPKFQEASEYSSAYPAPIETFESNKVPCTETCDICNQDLLSGCQCFEYDLLGDELQASLSFATQG